MQTSTHCAVVTVVRFPNTFKLLWPFNFNIWMRKMSGIFNPQDKLQQVDKTIVCQVVVHTYIYTFTSYIHLYTYECMNMISINVKFKWNAIATTQTTNDSFHEKSISKNSAPRTVASFLNNCHLYIFFLFFFMFVSASVASFTTLA